MIVRALTLIGALAGGAGMSQFPAFTHAYEQRLSGAVDELAVVVKDFDASASEAGLTRDEALAELQGTQFLASRQDDMTRTIERYEWLTATLNRMRLNGPFSELIQAPRFADTAIGRETLKIFEPSVPLTVTGLTFAAIGLVLGYLLVRIILGVLAWPFRRSNRRRQAA